MYLGRNTGWELVAPVLRRICIDMLGDNQYGRSKLSISLLGMEEVLWKTGDNRLQCHSLLVLDM